MAFKPKRTQEECRNEFRDLDARAQQLAKMIRERQIAKSTAKLKQEKK